MVEVMINKVPRRVNVWSRGDEVLVSFPAGMDEKEASAIIERGLGMLKPLNVEALFNDSAKKKLRRYIETEE